MTILQKLKDLVSALEEEKPQNDQPPAPETSESIEPLEDEYTSMDEIEEQSEWTAEEEFPDYLECEDHETVAVLAKVKAISKAKEEVANLVMLFEKRKAELINNVATKTNDLYGFLNSLKEEHGVPKEGYSVQLPSSPDDKVSFIKE